MGFSFLSSLCFWIDVFPFVHNVAKFCCDSGGVWSHLSTNYGSCIKTCGGGVAEKQKLTSHVSGQLSQYSLMTILFPDDGPRISSPSFARSLHSIVIECRMNHVRNHID